MSAAGDKKPDLICDVTYQRSRDGDAWPKEGEAWSLRTQIRKTEASSGGPFVPSAGARRAASRHSPNAVLGDVLWLMSQSPAHKDLRLADIDWLVVPAIINKQFRLYRVGNRPFAFVSWALLNEDAANRVSTGGTRLSASEWRSGDQPWLVDVVAPFGGAEGVVKDIRVKIFADRPLTIVQSSLGAMANSNSHLHTDVGSADPGRSST